MSLKQHKLLVDAEDLAGSEIKRRQKLESQKAESELARHEMAGSCELVSDKSAATLYSYLIFNALVIVMSGINLTLNVANKKRVKQSKGNS